MERTTLQLRTEGSAALAVAGNTILHSGPEVVTSSNPHYLLLFFEPTIDCKFEKGDSTLINFCERLRLSQIGS